MMTDAKHKVAQKVAVHKPGGGPARAGHGRAMTEGRSRVLDALAAEGRPLGAYDIIDRVAAKTGKRLAPISVYRALDHLVEHGFAHRLASRNAFLACAHAHEGEETVAFLICNACGLVAEASSPAISDSLKRVARKMDFKAKSEIVEIAGLCGDCRRAG